MIVKVFFGRSGGILPYYLRGGLSVRRFLERRDGGCDGEMNGEKVWMVCIVV